MAEGKTVVLTERAIQNMASAAYYISEKAYPESAARYYERMLNFAESLGLMPSKYALCKKRAFKRSKYRCANFENTYVFIYKVQHESVFLLRVLHGKQMS